MASSYPLQWPDAWKRTTSRRRSPFKIHNDTAMELLFGELRRFGARQVVVSSNLPVRADGLPYAGQPSLLPDPGVAVYYATDKFKEQTLACDKWISVHHNMYAIARTIESWRRIERDGASQILERAFAAFGALPAASNVPPVRPWWEVLALPKEALSFATLVMVEAQYRDLASKAHPDRGGSDAAMAELNRAREEAKQHFKGAP